MKALDFVKTKNGNIALITETIDDGKQASISFIGGGNPNGDKNAWYDQDELEVIDSLPHLLANATAHPFGKGKYDAELYYGIKKGQTNETAK